MMTASLRLAVGPAFLVAAVLAPASADSITFKPEGESHVVRTDARVTTQGKVLMNGGGGKTITHDLTAQADFTFAERRLPPGGRDAQSLRAVRDFARAEVQTTIEKNQSTIELPDSARVIVASGQLGGIENYSPNGLLTRDTSDLLEMPGDPLALVAMLPASAVEVDGTWTPPEWASQMLASVEAIEKVSVAGKLTALTDQLATIALDGTVKGQRQGANCEVAIHGTLEYDRSSESITAASLKYDVKSAVGTVNPGIEAQVDVSIKRSVLTKPGRLTDELVKSIPVSPEADSLSLAFDAAPWGMRLRHNRNWYVFHAVLEGTPQIAILRLIDRGSLIAQCNFSPIAAVSPGENTPLDQFEGDIKRTLGKRLKKIAAREQVNVGDEMKVFRVIVEGEYLLKGSNGEEQTVPTHWIYYLVAAPSGKQASFMFAVESSLLEQLGSQDEELVRSLQFIAERPIPRAADRTK